MKKSIVFLNAIICLFAQLLFSPFESLNAQTNFVKYTGNPLVSLGAAGQWDHHDISFVSVLFNDSKYKLWYSGSNEPGQELWRIGYATSNDGINWDKYDNNPVLGPGAPGDFDSNRAGFPCVQFNGDYYEMWYNGNLANFLLQIGYATSPDGINWTKYADNPVFDKGSPGAWDGHSVFEPCVVRTDTLYHMWYIGEAGNDIWQTGYATSPDGVNWTRYPDNPVLKPGEAGEWDSYGALVGSGSVLYEDGQYYMWYAGRSQPGPFYNIKIGLATSTDGIHWTKHPDNPILGLGTSGSWDANTVWGPVVRKEGYRYQMWYCGRKGPVPNTDRFGYAEDFSNAAHTDSIQVSSEDVLANSETIAIYAYIANPHSENLTARALIESQDGLINESVELIEYGNNIWRGSWDVPADAHHYSVSVELTNHTASYIHNSSDWGVIETFRSLLPTHNFIQTANINDGGEARSLTVAADGTVFLANWNDGLRAYSYDGTSFTLTASIDDGGTASDVALSSDGTIFLANMTDGLRAYHYDGTSFKNTAHVDDGGEAVAVTVAADGTVFLANWSDGLRAYRYDGSSFTNTAHINDIGNIGPVNGGDVAVTVDSIVFLAQLRELQAYRYDGASFTFTNLGSVHSVGIVRGAAVSADGTIFLSSSVQLFNPFNGGLESFTFDGTAFTRRATITDLTGQRLAVADSTVFLANWIDGLRAYSYNGSSLINTAHINDGNDARDVAVAEDGTVFLANGADGLFAYSYVSQPTSVIDDETIAPAHYQLFQNYPNPFNPTTVINYEVAAPGRIELAIYNTLGQEIRTLVNSTQSAGTHQTVWDGHDSRGLVVPSGVYFYRLQAGAVVETRKMLLIR